MTENPNESVNTLNVVGIAVGAAAVAGGILAALFGARQDESAIQADLRALQTDLRLASNKGAESLKRGSGDARKRAKERQGDMMERRRELVDKARTAAERSIREARSRAAQIDVQDITSTASERLGHVRDAGAGLAAAAGAEIGTRAKDAQAQVPVSSADLTERVVTVGKKATMDAKSFGTTIGGALRQNAAPMIREALHSASAAAGSGKRGFDDARKHAESDLIPNLKSLGERAAVTAGDAGHTLNDGAKSLGERAVEAASEATQVINQTAHQAERSLGPLASDAVERISAAGDALDERSRKVASTATRGAKDTTSFVFWGAAAAGLVYLAFLSPEQRGKVKESGGRILEEAKVILKDIRGYDEEF